MTSKKHAVIFKASDYNNPGSDPYCKQLEAIGIVCHTIPVISFRFIHQTELTSKLNHPESYSGIIFSSPRCVEAVSSCMLNPTCWKNHKIYAVGEKTSCELSKLGLVAEGGNCGNAESLANYILQSQHSKPLLLPIGNLTNNTISNTLKINGIEVDQLTVYETIENPDLNNSFKNVFENKISFALYFSPSGVDYTIPLYQINGINTSEIQFGAIGKTTAAQLQKNSLQPAFIAEKPNPECFAKALELIQR